MPDTLPSTEVPSVARPEEFRPPVRSSAERRRGRLHVFLGAAPGVGKTFATLDEGLQLGLSGHDRR
jgi:K+-sensing histidine kinase KdpD